MVNPQLKKDLVGSYSLYHKFCNGNGNGNGESHIFFYPELSAVATFDFNRDNQQWSISVKGGDSRAKHAIINDMWTYGSSIENIDYALTHYGETDTCISKQDML